VERCLACEAVVSREYRFTSPSLGYARIVPIEDFDRDRSCERGVSDSATFPLLD